VSIVTGDPRDYLKHVSTPDEAARLDDDLAETIARDGKRGPGRDDERLAELRAARKQLHKDHPEILERAFGETASGEPRPGGLGPSGKKLKRSGAAVTRTGRNQPKRPPRPAARRPSTGSPRRVASRSSNQLARALRTGVRDTGIPAAARSSTRTALNFLGAGFGLSILYLLLTNAEHAKPGKAAVELFAKGVGRTAQALVSPAVDPLSPNSTATKPVDLSGVNAGIAAGAQQFSATTGVPIIPGITSLLPPPPDLGQILAPGTRLPHLARPYTRPPGHVRRPGPAPVPPVHRNPDGTFSVTVP
jgi:hypothetical protein